MTLVLEAVALLVVAVLVAYVWDDLFDSLVQEVGPNHPDFAHLDPHDLVELYEFPLTADWTEHDVALTMAEIASL